MKNAGTAGTVVQPLSFSCVFSFFVCVCISFIEILLSLYVSLYVSRSFFYFYFDTHINMCVQVFRYIYLCSISSVQVFTLY